MLSYHKLRFGFFKTSNVEIRDILKAWLAVSIAFGIVLRNSPDISGIFQSFIIALVVVGTGFLLHELGHKIVAQRYHFKAEFRSFDEMLFLALIMSFFGFVFAAPGAVMIQTHNIDRVRHGKIALAGPAINITLAILFLFLQPLASGFLAPIIMYGLRINSWLALFNLIPVWLFDGAKIWRWNKLVWLAAVLIAGALLFYG